jgi:DNA-3-methyladenine glycosylase I
VNRPEHSAPTSLADYLDAMSRSVFSAGMSWEVIDRKWDGIRAAFADFDPLRVAAFTPADVERLMADHSVVRNRKKIEATIANAGELIVVEREFGSVDAYLRSFEDNDALIRDLHRRLAFLGESVAHIFLFRIGFNLPAQEEWAHRHFGAHAHG